MTKSLRGEQSQPWPPPNCDCALSVAFCKEDTSGGKFGPLSPSPLSGWLHPLPLADSTPLSAGLCLLVQHDFSTLICARDLIILWSHQCPREHFLALGTTCKYVYSLKKSELVFLTRVSLSPHSKAQHIVDASQMPVEWILLNFCDLWLLWVLLHAGCLWLR